MSQAETGGAEAAQSGQAYDERVHHELQSYKEERPELAIPAIFTYWASRYLAPRVLKIMGTTSPEEFFAIHLADRIKRGTAGNVIASLGCGDCGSEIQVAKMIMDRGVTDFRFECFDLSPYVLERAARAIDAAGYTNVFRLEAADLNAWKPAREGMYAGVMVNHALHHFLALEAIFDSIKGGLHDDGVFVNADMIGRNGHMRWPEALGIVEGIWRTLPSKYKYNHLLRRQEDGFVNWDCSDGNFEGIRAQDILPLLVKRFHFEKFVGFGNLPDVFVERTFGPNFDVNKPEDTALIDFLEDLNTRLIDAGLIKPTQMFAVMAKSNTGQASFDRGWSASFCVRDTSATAPVPGEGLTGGFQIEAVVAVPPVMPDPGRGKVQPDLIYDVGFHKGEDTEFYLTMGYRVVAIEANPDLVAEGKRKFADAIKSGRLRLLECAIGHAEGPTTFYINTECTEWSSVKKQLGTRNDRFKTVEVRVRHFRSILEEYGTPLYLKADIEGHDIICLEQMASARALPKFVSVEAAEIAWLEALRNLGYTRFKLVDQNAKARTPMRCRRLDGSVTQRLFSEQSTGPFGDDLPGTWVDGAAMSAYVGRPGWKEKATTWYDFHAARD